MTEVLDRSVIETAQETLLDQLAGAKVKRNALAFKAAMPGATEADEEALTLQDDAIRRLEIKLQALGLGMIRAESQERERLSAERLAGRRQAGVNIMALVNQRRWETEALDKAMSAAFAAVHEIERLGNEIVLLSSGWFGQEANAKNGFLMNIDCVDITDTTYKFSQDVDRSRKYAAGLPLGERGARQALAKVIPEVMDPEVLNEALALARRHADEDEEMA